MPYVVITGTKRQQFETLKDAAAYRSEESRVYLVDGFGNLSAISDGYFEEILKAENNNQGEVDQPFTQTGKVSNISADSANQPVIENKQVISPVQKTTVPDNNPQKIVVVQKTGEENLILRGLVFVVAVIIILFFIYMILKPYLEEFQSINSAFF